MYTGCRETCFQFGKATSILMGFEEKEKSHSEILYGGLQGEGFYSGIQTH